MQLVTPVVAALSCDVTLLGNVLSIAGFVCCLWSWSFTLICEHSSGMMPSPSLCCGKCNVPVKEDLIICSGYCGRPFHHSCSELTDDAIGILLSFSSIVWLCDGCHTGPTLGTLHSKLDSLIASLGNWKQTSSPVFLSPMQSPQPAIAFADHQSTSVHSKRKNMHTASEMHQLKIPELVFPSASVSAVEAGCFSNEQSLSPAVRPTANSQRFSKKSSTDNLVKKKHKSRGKRNGTSNAAPSDGFIVGTGPQGLNGLYAIPKPVIRRSGPPHFNELSPPPKKAKSDAQRQGLPDALRNAPFVVGTGPISVNGLSAVIISPPSHKSKSTKCLFIGKVCSDANAETVITHLMSNCGATRSDLVVQRIDKRIGDCVLYTSFRVWCSEPTLKKALLSRLWPRGVIIREFVNFKR